MENKIGEIWDKVYSEVCERINRNSAVQYHIWLHLMQYVCSDAVLENGVVFDSKGKRPFEDFYVDPVTGVLKKIPKFDRYSWMRQKPKSSPYVKINCKNYRRLEGIWYEVILEPVPKDVETVFDSVLREWLYIYGSSSFIEAHSARVYASAKRQLGKKEIKKLGINGALVPGNVSPT